MIAFGSGHNKQNEKDGRKVEDIIAIIRIGGQTVINSGLLTTFTSNHELLIA